jgi:predicted enzyme related to lactoylglutathione lyase
MAIATFKDLCLDAVVPDRLGPWWAGVLGLEWESNGKGGGRIVGPTPEHTIWICQVPEDKSVKQRVHLDIYTRSLADLEAAGSVVVEAQREGRGWTVMADPEGGEFCAFLRDELPAERLHGLVVDCTDAESIAQWWADVYGADVVHHDSGYSTVENAPGTPTFTMDFVPVPEPKTVKNRIHWDVTSAEIDLLVAAGGRVLRHRDEEIGWTVMADPEDNEFCVFGPAV